ncbi:MAG: hypothetical protein LBS01_07820 [Prevotellaceae bacterium]|nr:hypothetical protein [Prevotellaceae bacterium]
MGLSFKNKLAIRRIYGVKRLVGRIGVETCCTDRLFHAIFVCKTVNN